MLLFHKKTEEQDGEVLNDEIFVDGMQVFVVDDTPKEEEAEDDE